MAVLSLRRIEQGVRLLAWRLRCFQTARSLVEGKRGLEIGGPSVWFEGGVRPLPIYPLVGSLDNCDFSRDTAWAAHQEAYTFHAEKPPGKNIFRDASDLSGIADHLYDFVLSSHNLEHFANPVKALLEWKRVIRPGGGLIVVLPDNSRTFDHQRTPTSVDHMFEDFERDTQEDDLTHMPEILEKHDLGMDPLAGSAEEFQHRCLNNFENRCLHHHVFDKRNSRELLARCGMTVLAVELARPMNIFLLARVP